MTTPATFDASRPYQLDPQVALRPEPFGALAYHYGNRRLVFLRARELVELVEDLANHPTAESALAARPEARRRALYAALSSLEQSQVISAR